MAIQPLPDGASGQVPRSAIFISHANPEDNVFTVWLGAKLTALGYEVWADIFRLRVGHDWQRLLEDALRAKAAKVLLVGTPTSVQKQGVRNEIQIAHDVANRIGDNQFILPLSLAPFDAPFLIAHAQYIDFSKSWSQGLVELLDTLENTYHIPRNPSGADGRWQEVQTIHASSLRQMQESLTSNWAAIDELPSKLRFFGFERTSNREDLEHRLKIAPAPAVKFGDGFLSFADTQELIRHFGLDAIKPRLTIDLNSYLSDGWPGLNIDRRTAQTQFSDLTRQGLENFLHGRGLNGYEMSNGRLAWWAPLGVTPVGKVAFGWGGVSGRRQIQGASLKKGFYWHFGVTANVRLWPRRHVRFTSRLIFTEDGSKEMDSKRMHRLRRSFAKSWRNPRWRDMFLAFLSWLAEGAKQLVIPMSTDQRMVIRLPPLRFVAPVGIPQELDAAEADDDEEVDGESDDEEHEEFDADDET